jgi:hypothetical protein
MSLDAALVILCLGARAWVTSFDVTKRMEPKPSNFDYLTAILARVTSMAIEVWALVVFYQWWIS